MRLSVLHVVCIECPAPITAVLVLRVTVCMLHSSSPPTGSVSSGCGHLVHVHAAADASAFICGRSGAKTAHDIAEATAEAFALAVATASAECKLSGDASAYVNAEANARAAADVWLEAYASAFAQAGDCNQCSAFASSWGYVQKHVFLEAVAKAGFAVRTLPFTPPLLPPCSGGSMDAHRIRHGNVPVVHRSIMCIVSAAHALHRAHRCQLCAVVWEAGSSK